MKKKSAPRKTPKAAARAADLAAYAAYAAWVAAVAAAAAAHAELVAANARSCAAYNAALKGKS